MVRAGEIEHGRHIAEHAEAIWNWSSAAGRRRATRRASLIIEAAHLSPADRVLELGCGTGLFSERFATTGCRLVAIDVSPALLEHAVARELGDKVEFRVDDAERLSFDDATFDAVVGSSVLHHLDLTQALSEIHRVLKQGGRIAFAEPNMMNPQIALQRSVPLFRRWAGESPEETAFFRRSLAEQLRANGFTNVRIEPFDFLHPVTPRPLIGLVGGLGGMLERIPGVREIAGSLIISGVRPMSDSPCTRSTPWVEEREFDSPTAEAMGHPGRSATL